MFLKYYLLIIKQFQIQTFIVIAPAIFATVADTDFSVFIGTTAAYFTSFTGSAAFTEVLTTVEDLAG
jgi:hypothetical protein